MKHILVRDVLRERMIRTTFGVLINIPSILMDGLLVNDIIASYCNNDKCFIIGERRVQFTIDDVAMIFGLRNDGWKVELTGHVWRDSYLEQKYSTSPDLSRDNLKQLMISLADKDDVETIDDFCSLWFLLMSGRFLFLGTGYNAPRHLLRYLVKNPNNLHALNWARAIHEYTMEEVGGLSKRLHSMRASIIPAYVGFHRDCSLALMLWVYQHTNMCSPSFFALEWPRLKRWSTPFHHNFDRLSRVTEV